MFQNFLFQLIISLLFKIALKKKTPSKEKVFNTNNYNKVYPISIFAAVKFIFQIKGSQQKG